MPEDIRGFDPSVSKCPSLKAFLYSGDSSVRLQSLIGWCTLSSQNYATSEKPLCLIFLTVNQHVGDISFFYFLIINEIFPFPLITQGVSIKHTGYGNHGNCGHDLLLNESGYR